MAYETGTASNIQDLFSKLETFASANGWTVDQSASSGASDRLFLTRSTCSVGFVWATASPTCAAVYQHTAYISSGTTPGNHTNDSGMGYAGGTLTNANLLTGRHVPLVNSTMTYWFFESDTYVHIEVETATQRFHSFGFGILSKLGTWTGGAYSYATYKPTTGTANLAITTTDSWLLDGLNDQNSRCAVMRCESLPNQNGSGKWGVVWGSTGSTGNDRAAVVRANIAGGFRGGGIARNFARFGGVVTSGLVPMYPIECFYKDPSNPRWYPLGSMLDVRGFNVKNYSGGDEILVGGDTWVIFPARFKTSVSSSDGTRNLGMAYRKVTA